MEKDFIVRIARKEDSEKIDELFIQMNNFINKQNRRNGIPYDTNKIISGYREGYLDTFFNNDSRFILVAENNKEVIGYLTCIVVLPEVEDSYLYLGDFCVDEKYRGNSVGLKLMNEANNYAEEKDLSGLRLYIDSRNKGSLRSYMNLGFVELNQAGNRIEMGKAVIKEKIKTI